MRLTREQQLAFDKGTAFQQEVWRAIGAIPKGQVRSYAQLAVDIGRPKAARAVANACGKNPCAPTIPCHRVVASGGKLGGFSGKGGVAAKRKLLKGEGVLLFE